MSAPGKFDLADLINRADMTTGSLAKKVNQAEVLVSNALRDVIWPNEQLDVIFFAFQGGKPELFVRGFVENESGGAEMFSGLQFQCSPCEDKDMKPYYFGKMGAITSLLHRNPEFAGRPAIKLAKELVQAEIDSVPQEVGPPIAELSIGPDEAEWIARGSCSWSPRSHSATRRKLPRQTAKIKH
jgi:hypothetical protein